MTLVASRPYTISSADSVWLITMNRIPFPAAMYSASMIGLRYPSRGASSKTIVIPSCLSFRSGTASATATHMRSHAFEISSLLSGTTRNRSVFPSASSIGSNVDVFVDASSSGTSTQSSWFRHR